MELQQERVIRAKALGFFKGIKPNSFHREGCLGSDLLGSNDAGPSQRLGGACLDFQGNLPLELQFLWLTTALSMQSAVSGSLSATTSSAKSPRETAPSTKITRALPNVRQAVVPGSCGAESVRAHTLVFFGVSLLNPDLGGCQLVWMLLVAIVWMLLATRRGRSTFKWDLAASNTRSNPTNDTCIVQSIGSFASEANTRETIFSYLRAGHSGQTLAHERLFQGCQEMSMLVLPQSHLVFVHRCPRRREEHHHGGAQAKGLLVVLQDAT